MESDKIFLRLVIAFSVTVFVVFAGIANGHWYGYASAFVVGVLGSFMVLGGSMALSEAMEREAKEAKKDLRR